MGLMCSSKQDKGVFGSVFIKSILLSTPPARQFFGDQHRGRPAGAEHVGKIDTAAHANAKHQPPQKRRINETTEQANAKNPPRQTK